jgi:hypothetical protein
MGLVVVERRFAAPVTAAAVQAADREAGWCLGTWRVEPVAHLLSADGLGLACVFAAPDAEAVRQVMAQQGMASPARLWPAELWGFAGGSAALRAALADAAGAGSLVVVERSFTEPFDPEVFNAPDAAGDACLALNRVSLVASLQAIDRRRMVCLFAAPDGERVRHVNRRLGLAIDAAWTARVLAPVCA